MSSDPVAELSWLCSDVVADTGVTCCGVTMATAGGQSVTAHATDARARDVEDLQHTLGEGPGVAASTSGTAVLVRDLGDLQDTTLQRWPAFTKDATGLGVWAAFAFPLLLGTSSIGALSLYRTEPGDLSPEGVSRGWATAGAVTLSLVDSGERVPDDSSSWEPADPMRVHQAAGMVTVQLDLPINEALLRMRAAAYAGGQTVDELADAIVGRRRRLSEEDT